MEGVLNTVKLLWPVLLAVLICTGCRTSTIDTRRAERASAYAALPPDTKRLVDQGQVRVGMSEDAVYIAWGAPSQVLRSENQSGSISTWLYHGSWMQETRYWAYREVYRDNVINLERYLEHDYNPRDYVQAEITFANGKVQAWRTLPQPLMRGN